MRIAAAVFVCAFIGLRLVPAAGAGQSSPSFDCTRAATAIEHLTCDHPALASLDTAVADAFRNAREKEDAPARAASLQSQRQWLQSRNAACAVPLKGDLDPAKSDTATACLVAMYDQRVAALKASASAIPATPASGSGTSGLPHFDKTLFPATGAHDAILDVPAFGRFAVAVKSDQGTALQLIDRMAGPVGQEGSAGHADGRIDTFLDHGQYKVKLSADPHGSGDAELSVVPSVELEDAPRQLVELKPLDADLDDHQQRSYWLNIATRRDVAIEASGRYLDDLRIWRDGKWLVDATPAASVADAASGQPLAVRQLAVTLEPGLYTVTAYGGRGQKWANASEARPLHIRYGLPTLAEAGRTHRIASATGIDRVLIPATATYVRLDIDQPERAAVSMTPYDPKTPFLGGSNRATIAKTSRDPFAELSGVQGPEGGLTLVTVEYRPGAPYRLTWFDDRQERTELAVRAGESGWLATYNSGNDLDQLDPTVVVADPKDTVIASTAIKVNKAIAWKRRFNLLAESSLYLEVTEPVDLSVDGAGADVEFRIEPVIARTSYRAPPDEPSGYVWKVDPGFYRLNIGPKPSGKGVLELALHAQGTPAPAVEAPHQAAAMLPLNFTATGGYVIYGNTQAGVHGDLRVYNSPVNLASGAAFEMAGGQSIDLPVSISTEGRVTATVEDGTVLPVIVDKTPAAPAPDVSSGLHSLTIALPPGDPGYVSVVFTPASLLGDAPLPAIDAKTIAGLPAFPVLAKGKPAYLDLAPAQHATFMVPVTDPGLYRLESTGLIETDGMLRTRVLPSLDSESANGIGRNFLIQRYLGQGDYQLTVTPTGTSHGAIGVMATETTLKDLGTLSPGLTARVTLPSSQAGLYTFHIDRAEPYHLQTLGQGHDFAMRLEDAEGWPLLPPGITADITRDFQPGDYRMVLLPGAVDNRAVTLLARVEKPVEHSGHGPWPATLGSAMSNRWMEPAPGQERAPDRWTISLPGPAETTVSLDNGMQATVTGTGHSPIGVAQPGKDWTGHAARRLRSRCRQRAAEQPRQLHSDGRYQGPGRGRRRSVQAPANIPVSIGVGPPVEINSYGDKDVRARLTMRAVHWSRPTTTATTTGTSASRRP